ncbi:hypothetical protein Agabi119p4_6435 [Agaricus bisporus var. burnettii]|uniref:Nitrogen regulatory protein areA GATA-like domain-containing protein n=1 Tax=Agaricus bisporus var. burnettii TaxID=192524 RepID=A0A8H7C9W8_AGABI|nr:hypothetical protein Agabi119p4_6435 [Agaricus bisporus var. burnettii]
MANYLPVLLISVNANAIPDDNALTTIPSGQVDYLSHDWQEEDVWRSWRNMTRQKNEITNGVRLENASWRTWWKQRNNLKTVSPETLNWLKDSDVTWLYGPLHRAVEWTPPPRPAPVPDSVDSAPRASTQDRLDLHSASRISLSPRTKPILKHRSISELLTSDLPHSPIFSPPESEDESNRFPPLFATSEEKSSTSHTTHSPKRPGLVHTKSDTHVTRWGPSRFLRKESPPRVQPSLPKSDLCQSTSTIRASGAVRSSVSQDSHSSGSSEPATKKKHISFNTFVEQCIAIDKHPHQHSRRKGFDFEDLVHFGYDNGEDEDETWDDDDGYEEDREDNLYDEDDPLWIASHGGVTSRRGHLDGSAIHSDSDSDDGVIEIRPSSYRHANLAQNLKRKPISRSKSVSSTSSTTTSSTSISSTGAPLRRRRKSAPSGDSIPPSHNLSVPPPTSTYRPRPPHPSHADPCYRDRVTIAPIPPTLLKTNGAWEEGFGDECGASDDNLWDFVAPQYDANGKPNSKSWKHRQGDSSRREDEAGSDGTSVELVYVPPLGSVYGYGATTYWRNRGATEEEDDDNEAIKVEDEDESDAQLTKKREYEMVVKSPVLDEHEPNPSSSALPAESTQSVANSPVPVVIVESDTDLSYPASDIPAESSPNSSVASSVMTTPVPVPSRDRQPFDEGQSRDRGRNTSISPIGSSTPSKSNSGASSGALTSKGRTQSYQDLQSFRGDSPLGAPFTTNERRGRLTSRVSSASSLRGHSSRSYQSSSGGRSGESGSLSPNVHSSSSPMGGSLSPDQSDARLGGIGSVYAGGRLGGRERERVERRKKKYRVWLWIEREPDSSPGVDIDASICSASSEGSTATIVPTRTPLTPSFSKHERTASASSTNSQTTPRSKIKSPPPIVPTPPYPSFPSTSPSYAPGEVSPSPVFTGFGDIGRSASRSFERASSGSRDRSSPSSPPLRVGNLADMEHERELAESRRGRNRSAAGYAWATASDTSKSGEVRLESVTSGLREREAETILNKAVGMVSNAGAYLRFWPSAGAS